MVTYRRHFKIAVHFLNNYWTIIHVSHKEYAWEMKWWYSCRYYHFLLDWY